jgi:NDP-sugar pyrophosphorylase family protein
LGQKYLPSCYVVDEISPEAATNYGCIVADPQTHEVLHYVEKPSSYISSTINCGVYLFDTSLFGFIREVMNKVNQFTELPDCRENRIKQTQGVAT